MGWDLHLPCSSKTKRKRKVQGKTEDRVMVIKAQPSTSYISPFHRTFGHQLFGGATQDAAGKRKVAVQNKADRILVQIVGRLSLVSCQ